MVRLAEVGHDWLFHLPRPDVEAVSIHPGVQGILRLSDILQTGLFARYKIDQIFRLACDVASDVVLSSCNLASECTARYYFFAAFSFFYRDRAN